MGNYATTTHVQARLPYNDLTASSKPTTTQVDLWIDEAEAIIIGALLVNSYGAPAITGTPATIMRAWVCDYSEGHARFAHAVDEDSDGNSGVASALLEKFERLIVDIVEKPTVYAAMLGVTTSTALQLRSYATNNTDDLSIADGDFDPEFTIEEKF